MKRYSTEIYNELVKVCPLKMKLRYTNRILRVFYDQLRGIYQVDSWQIKWYAKGAFEGILKVYQR